MDEPMDTYDDIVIKACAAVIARIPPEIINRLDEKSLHKFRCRLNDALSDVLADVIAIGD
jgi:hypothetical protein